MKKRQKSMTKDDFDHFIEEGENDSEQGAQSCDNAAIAYITAFLAAIFS